VGHPRHALPLRRASIAPFSGPGENMHPLTCAPQLFQVNHIACVIGYHNKHNPGCFFGLPYWAGCRRNKHFQQLPPGSFQVLRRDQDARKKAMKL
jgi:hypothetical protein